MAQDKQTATPAKGEQGHSPPSIPLPKGGGAIRGIGEKFAANPVTGTGSMTVPIATSPGRSGFGPQLSLSYDSGAGNGPFGFGWSLSLPSITRKTDKGLPQYRDAEDSDIFILSGAEDLVPVLVEEEGAWRRDPKTRTVDGVEFRVERYRPRIEGLFARIERWENLQTGDVHWRSISRDSITTLYGKDNNSRVFDPSDPDPAHPRRIFSWLICQSYDDKGNAIVYEYDEEDSERIDRSQAHERNRTPESRSANRYLKRVRYGNRRPNRDEGWNATDATLLNDWLFEVVFDYGEGHYDDVPLGPGPEAEQHRFVRAAASLPRESAWPVRPDPFSSYRAGFEVRTYRRCHRVLMFHRFEELGPEPYLVRSTEFDYDDLDYAKNPTIDVELAHEGSTRTASFIRAVTQSGFVRDENQEADDRNGVKYVTYLKKSLPPLEFKYSQAAIQEDVRELDADSLENLPYGLDGRNYQWVDLDGEGVSGILTEQANAWFYKPNLGEGHFGPVERVAAIPSLAALSTGRQQLLDLAGDGQLDLAEFGGPTPGFYERTHDQQWEHFTPFSSLPRVDWDDPNLRFVDLNGDGHADVLLTEHEAFTWYPSLAEEGFGPARRVSKPLDEERGPRLVFADGTQSIYLADMSGDGLSDLARIRNGEVCYWPNLGYGRFGPKVTMDNAPWLDVPDQFDQRRVRLADIDGTGNTDIIYLGQDAVRLYFNESGNRWSEARPLHFPAVDNVGAVTAVDLLSNGTACLVWSSPLPGDTHRPVRYVKLMGEQKPHLLIKLANNLGAETRVHYAPSTRFYLADKQAGRPWITRLPFPVHVVERVETFDWISRNRFVTRYEYHHGYFDGIEREFRGFGLVEQQDTEEFGALTSGGEFPTGDNIDPASHVPPVLTKTWFHTGVYIGRDHVSDYFAGLVDFQDRGEYYREPAWLDDDVEARKRLLDDTVLPANLTPEEEREACRALKGLMLRQEVYALDDRGSDDYPHGHPYAVTEQNFTLRRLQPRDGNRQAVFVSHPRETVTYHYERNPADPRVSHALTLEVDDFGNVLRSVMVGYPRADVPEREAEQKKTHITLALSRFANRDDRPDWRRVGLTVETRTYELVKPPTASLRFAWGELRALVESLVPLDQNEPAAVKTISYEQWDWRKQWDPQAEPGGPAITRLRLIEHVRTRYRPDDLGVAQNDTLALLPLGAVEQLALPGETYKLGLTRGLLNAVYGSRASDDMLAVEGRYVHTEGDADWWIPSGRIFYSPERGDTPAQELAYARQHFFLPHRYRDPFDTDAARTETVVTYDAFDLLVIETRDPLDNVVTVETADDEGRIAFRNDYRVLQPWWVTDPNRNRTRVAFDALGMVTGTAVMGKPGESVGDPLDEFYPDLTQADIDGFHLDPHVPAQRLIKSATTRIVYDLDTFRRSRKADPQDPQKWLPVYAATLARETHTSDPTPLKVQISFSYSDGLGREIQKKIQAEPEKVNGVAGAPRWVGSGWTIFNNKGKPVRQYEPFFSQLPEGRHRFEFGVQAGVSPILFYDPVERVVATLHPNHTYEKVVFDPWSQTTYDVNDTVAPRAPETGEPRTDQDIKGYVDRYFKSLVDQWNTWHADRIGGAKGPEEQDAAAKAQEHANTPTTAHLDALGRTVLTLAHNGFRDDATPIQYATRGRLDIEGNLREVRDALARLVMRYDYDMLGTRIHQASMEAGERWTLNDFAGKPIREWDSREHEIRTQYDQLRRATAVYLRDAGAAEVQVGRTTYGESPANPEVHNLRERVVEVRDQAGVLTTAHYDFKGNLLESKRRLAIEYRVTLNWLAGPPMEAESFVSRTRYDALNRPIQLIAPHSDQGMPRINLVQPIYNEANLLEEVHVWLGRDTDPGEWLDPTTATMHAVTNIDYDAKGQRTLIEYGNRTKTTYQYDEETFRLASLKTTRPAGLNGVSPQLFADPTIVQDLRYAYDPAGNITAIVDDALPVIQYNNENVEPRGDFVYDAIYRLLIAKGREHIGQTAFDFAPADGNYRDYPFVGLRVNPNDPRALRNYTETYDYDEVGNIKTIGHTATGGSWTRNYAYQEASLLEPTPKSNRLSSTTVGDRPPEPFSYDAHGNITRMDHLPLMRWDYRDQLQATAQQVVNNGTTETTWYVYDAAGQRARKVTDHAAAAGQTPKRKAERIYLGGFEIYRLYDGDGSTRKLERETLHVMDDKQRIAIVETLTIDNFNPVNAWTPLERYQLGNHLGSSCLELASDGALISYEEYHPYGTSAFQAWRSLAEVSLKRYRYTYKERDDETGFYYHGARYYAPWLARWTCPDPIGVDDNLNVYGFVRGNPVSGKDPNGMQSLWTSTREFIGSQWKQAANATRSAQRWVKETGFQLGATSLERAELAIDVLGIENQTVKTIIRTGAAVEATAVSTLFEVAAGVLMVGPNVVEGLDTAGTNIGEGIGRATYGESSEERWLGVAQASGGVAQGALTTVEVLSVAKGVSTGRQTAQPGAAEAQGKASKRLGREFETEVAQRQKSVTTDVSEKLRVQPLEPPRQGHIGPLAPARKPDGKPLIREIDVVQRNRLTRRLKATEAKATAAAPYRKQQQLADQLLERYGGIVRSRKGEILSPLRLSYGETLGPIQTTLMRNTTFSNAFLVPLLIANQARFLTEDYLNLRLTPPRLLQGGD